MNRRRFITIAVMAPVTVAVAKFLPEATKKLSGSRFMYAADKITAADGSILKDKHEPITRAVEWQPKTSFEPGDMIHVDFPGKSYSGTYRMNNDKVFVRVTKLCGVA